jgi:MFS superfamily sulfate permease-like transporter
MTTTTRWQERRSDAGDSGCGLGVERGPDWLFVRLDPFGGGQRERLAESVWETIQEHGASRVVLELDGVQAVNEPLRAAIAEIGSRLRDAGGLVRICGLSEAELSKLRSLPAAAAVPHFGSRAEAVGRRPAGTGPCE